MLLCLPMHMWRDEGERSNCDKFYDDGRNNFVEMEGSVMGVRRMCSGNWLRILCEDNGFENILLEFCSFPLDLNKLGKKKEKIKSLIGSDIST